jgi:DNA-binding transcriptional ArsR family regulator
MLISNSDRDTLRVVSAFQEIKSPGTRRAILRLLEELVEKQSKSATTKGD